MLSETNSTNDKQNIEHQEHQVKRSHIQRYLFIYFLDDGILARHLKLRGGTAYEGRKIFFRNLSEKTFSKNRMFKIFLAATFFPFRYKVICVAPHCFCQSKLFKVSFGRSEPKAPVHEEELNGYFSQSIWKELEKNKKEIAEKNGFDDLTTLLVNNVALEAKIGKKYFSQDAIDSVIGETGAGLEFSFLQSFVYRPLFAAIHRIIPKRARVASFFEEGFGAALRARMMYIEEGKDRKFIFALVGTSETDVYVYDGESLFFHDSFAFGYRTLYEAFHGKLHVDFDSFGKLLKAFTEGNVSTGAQAYFNEVLTEEIARFQNGIGSFKRQFNITTHYIYPGKLEFLLEKHKKIAPSIISLSFLEMGIDEISLKVKPDIYMLKVLLKKNSLTRLSTKFIRWLIPHTIEM